VDKELTDKLLQIKEYISEGLCETAKEAIQDLLDCEPNVSAPPQQQPAAYQFRFVMESGEWSDWIGCNENVYNGASKKPDRFQVRGLYPPSAVVGEHFVDANKMVGDGDATSWGRPTITASEALAAFQRTNPVLGQQADRNLVELYLLRQKSRAALKVTAND